jgi:outer membrane receptor protein involved in Fe transport
MRALLPVLAASLSLLGQSPFGELRITVRDPSGAALPASGLLQSSSTNLRIPFKTDPQGAATLSALPLGPYSLQISKAGFTTHTASFTISSSPLTLPVVLNIGISTLSVNVVSATPLPGLDRSIDQIPAPTQTASGLDLQNSGALDLSAFLHRRFNNVYLNEIQGNPLQPDLNYRGFTASPLLGTPQGISIFMDGVRLNQPFADVVSWDLIPRVALAEMALMPGSNPLFGLNTLGGSLSLRSKDGLTHPSTSLQFQSGSFARKTADFEHGASLPNGLHWFLAGSLFFEDGWRQASPSNVRQFFSKLGSQRPRSSINLTLAYANNSLTGNGLQDHRLLASNFNSIYTKPDITANRSPFLNLAFRRTLSPAFSLSANAYFRHIRTRTLNGDLNDDSLDQSLYQPNAAERTALSAAGFSGFPAAGESAANTPFPRWRCIANALRRDEPAEKCNGLLNRAAIQQRNFGLSGQLSWFSPSPSRPIQLILGAAYDGNSASFQQATELGYLNPDRSITGVGAFGDGVTGGDVDGEPYDTLVRLSGRIHSSAAYATAALNLSPKLVLTLSGRFNATIIDNLDRLRPKPGTGSLTGHHTFARFNPAIGATYKLAPLLTTYASYTEGNRAPTSIELGCADPQTPCKLPNAMASDPPLEQVRTRTFEAGLRGSAEGSLRWSAGWFLAANRDDILFVASQQTGYGYFKNFGKTRRHGLELDSTYTFRRLSLTGGYTLLDATFQSAEKVNGAGNSTNDAVAKGRPGTDGNIDIQPGNRIPLIPRHMLKTNAGLQVTRKLQVDLGVTGISSSLARGNENNLHRPDGRYYLGQGDSPGYAVVNLGGRYDIHPRLQLTVQVNNLFDRTYYSGAQLGPTGFTAQGNFLARPFPAISGQYPLQGVTFFAPGAPRGAWAGFRFQF